MNYLNYLTFGLMLVATHTGQAEEKTLTSITKDDQKAICEVVKGGWAAVKDEIEFILPDYPGHNVASVLKETYCITTDSFREGYIERYAMYEDAGSVIYYTIEHLKPYLEVIKEQDGSLSGRGGELLTWIAQRYAKTGDVDYLEYGRKTAGKLDAYDEFAKLINQVEVFDKLLEALPSKTEQP